MADGGPVANGDPVGNGAGGASDPAQAGGDPVHVEPVGKEPAPGKNGRELQVRLPAWVYAILRSLRNFLEHRATDHAAALTYFAVLAVGPALIALVSTLAIVGRSEQVLDGMIEILGEIAPASTVESLEPVITRIAASSPQAGLGLFLGLVGALWSASAYVSAFGRVMNAVFEVEEGRPIWKLRPQVLLVTLTVLILVVASAVSVIVSGPFAIALAEQLGLGADVVSRWDNVKWPVVILLVTTVVALLYYATPNVHRPRLRFFSAGAVVAILVWIGASVGFAYYVSRFASFDATYGSLGGFVVFLLWLWITNIALIFGAELDAELERRRQLLAGVEAEAHLQLPLRDDSAVRKRAQQRDKAIAIARVLRDRARAQLRSAAGSAEASADGDEGGR